MSPERYEARCAQKANNSHVMGAIGCMGVLPANMEQKPTKPISSL